MIRINLHDNIINTSLQVGDVAYYVETVETNGPNNEITNFTDQVKVIGKIDSIGVSHVVVDSTVFPPSGAFIMFQKDRLANNTSLLGYFAEVKLSNNSTEKAELFALSSEITQSSK